MNQFFKIKSDLGILYLEWKGTKRGSSIWDCFTVKVHRYTEKWSESGDCMKKCANFLATFTGQDGTTRKVFEQRFQKCPYW